MAEFQELHCHHCKKYVTFPTRKERNGNLIVICPNCGHQHCRVVKDGIVTGDKWDRKNGLLDTIKGKMRKKSVWDDYKGDKSSTFLAEAWGRKVL